LRLFNDVNPARRPRSLDRTLPQTTVTSSPTSTSTASPTRRSPGVSAATAPPSDRHASPRPAEACA